MKFRNFVLFFVLLFLGLVIQQSLRYLVLSKELTVLKGEGAELAYLIERAMYEEGAILQQLKKAERRHSQLRALLPSELQEESIEQQVGQLAKEFRIKVLATKTAINSRSLYHEATLDITLEASTAQVKQFIKALHSNPRIINITPLEQLGKKNINLSISIYALSPAAPDAFTRPHCIEMPGGILLPPLNERLSSLYADYSRHCRYIENYGEIYLKQRQLRALQEENSQLQAVARQLGRNR
jgi:Tfp pilus assembly protein PilO